MEANGGDVILSMPLYVALSLKENYKNRHNLQDWEYMMQCLKERDEETWREAEDFFKRGLYSPCNIADHAEERIR